MTLLIWTKKDEQKVQFFTLLSCLSSDFEGETAAEATSATTSTITTATTVEMTLMLTLSPTTWK